jgi:hypothetical protein
MVDRFIEKKGNMKPRRVNGMSSILLEFDWVDNFLSTLMNFMS